MAANPLAETGKRLFSNVQSAFRKRKRDAKTRNRRMDRYAEKIGKNEDLWGHTKVDITIQDEEGEAGLKTEWGQEPDDEEESIAEEDMMEEDDW